MGWQKPGRLAEIIVPFLEKQPAAVTISYLINEGSVKIRLV